MTGLEVLALTVGTTVGAVLGTRAWRRSPDNRAPRVFTEEEAHEDRVQRQQCDAIIVRFEQLAGEGFMDRLALDRAYLLHDVATHADCPSERAAARSELVAMAAATPTWNTADESRVPQTSEADGPAVPPAPSSSTCDILAGS